MVGTFPFKLPVCVVDEHEDPWTTKVDSDIEHDKNN